MKKLKYLSIISLAVAVLFSSCGDGGKKTVPTQHADAKGGVVYGGVFRINEVEDFRNLFPLNVTEVTSHRITSQVYEGLVKFNQSNLTIQPCIAKSWDVNEDATKFTFHLRKGVMFQDDECFPNGKGREVTAEDFKYSFTELCSLSPENQMYWLFKDRVVGANEYYQSTVEEKPLAEGVTGIKVLDSHTLEINLSYPFAGFISILGHSGCWVFPQEAYEKYGIDMRTHCVGTGAFMVKNVKEGEAVILSKNPNYWRSDKHGNKLPYLDAIKFTFLKEKKSELMEFKKGNLDMVFKLPLEMVDAVTGELEEAKSGGNTPFVMQVKSAFAVQYYGFQHQSELFNNKDLRKAFNYALDKEKLVTYTLQGDGFPAKYGAVPPGFVGYEYDSLRGYEFNPKLAKEYLAKAGYPNGEGFPEIKLQLNSGGSRNTQLAEAVQSILKEHLNINIKLDIMPFAQHLDKLETGKALFWRTAWVADYPDPENFLNLFYSPHIPATMEEKSFVNSVRYKNEKFDELFSKALNTVDKKERFRLYRMADQVAIDDAAILPIFYDEFTRLIQTNVKNFPQNAMELRDLSEVFFKESEF